MVESIQVVGSMPLFMRSKLSAGPQISWLSSRLPSVSSDNETVEDDISDSKLAVDAFSFVFYRFKY